MSVLNLAPQFCGLAREEMDPDFEKKFGKCNNMVVVRKLCESLSSALPSEPNGIDDDEGDDEEDP